MKYLFIFVFSFISLHGVDYVTLFKEGGKGYDGYNVSIRGKFYSYRCFEETRRMDSHCRVSLKVYENNILVFKPTLKVGSTYESSLKDSDVGDYYSFDCTYNGSIYVLESCK